MSKTEKLKGKEIKVGEGGNGLMWKLGVLVDELGNRNGPHFKPDPIDRGLNFVAKLKEKGFTLICDDEGDFWK